MNNFRNNHKRYRYRSNGDRNFKKRNGESQKFSNDYSSNINPPTSVDMHISNK